MVHLERIYEEIRVLNIKDETLLSFRVFENFIKRRQHFDTIRMGFFPDRTTLTDEEDTETFDNDMVCFSHCDSLSLKMGV